MSATERCESKDLALAARGMTIAEC